MLEMSILKRQVLIGKGYELYSEGQSPEEEADTCPKASSEVSASQRGFQRKGSLLYQ